MAAKNTTGTTGQAAALPAVTKSLNTFADLAHWLLLGAVNAGDIAEQNFDLIGAEFDSLMPLDLAVGALESGDFLQAVAHLNDAIAAAAQPVTPPTTGRNRLERFQRATDQRDSLRRTAQIARALVLDAIKAGEVSA
jgi:hypothetical protein